MALTSAQKQKALRERKSYEGLFRIREFWCHPDDEPKLRDLEKELRLKRIFDSQSDKNHKPKKDLKCHSAGN